MINYLFGTLETTTFWHRRKERFITILITLPATLLFLFFVIGRISGIAIENMRAWEIKKTREMKNAEKTHLSK